jgi:hypothetical protein
MDIVIAIGRELAQHWIEISPLDSYIWMSSTVVR